MVNIRAYVAKDYGMLSDWWKSTKEVVPTEEMIPPTTFILEIDNVPVVSLGLIVTNCKAACYLANFIANPEIKERKESTKRILSFVREYSKNLGYQRILAFAYEDKLKKRFSELGMKPTLSNLQAFVVE